MDYQEEENYRQLLHSVQVQVTNLDRSSIGCAEIMVPHEIEIIRRTNSLKGFKELVVHALQCLASFIIRNL